MTTLLGVARTGRIPGNATVRVKWKSAHPWLGTDALFSRYFPSVFDQISSVAHLYPLSASGVLPGDTSAVIDFGNRQERFASEVVSALESLDNNAVAVDSVQVLSGTEKQQANTNAGAQSRGDAVDQANKASQSNGLFGKLEDMLKSVGHVALVIIVIVVIVALAYAANTARKVTS